MKINDTIINADCDVVLSELQSQLAINNIQLLQKMKDSGNDIMIQCPYHGNGQERKPSAGIRKSDGQFHCFACGETHSLPEVISYCFGKDDMFGQWGMKWLLKNFSAVSIEERDDIEIDMERNNITNKNNLLPNKKDILATDNSDKSKWVSEEELDSYRYYHWYWKERGIVDNSIIELFDLGYDKKTDCITFPVRDIKGNCLFVARRSVKTKWFNYPKDVEKPLYGLYELKLRKWSYVIDSRKEHIPTDLYITESMIDCILLWQAGHYAVALNGTGSDLQYKQLKDLPYRHLVLATDNDKAGMQAKEKIRKNVPNKLMSEIMFPSNIKDVGDLGKARRFDDIKHIEQWEVM